MNNEYSTKRALLGVAPSNSPTRWRFLSRRRSGSNEAYGIVDEHRRPKRKTKRERFLEIGEKRTQAVLDRLRLLGNCGNQTIYEYKDEEVGRIFAAIEDELRRIRARFERKHHRAFRLN